MNIATKLIAGLVAGLVLTACSGGGSSGSSSKPNSELTPKVDMSAPKAEQPKKEEVPQADNSKAEEPKEMAPQVDSPKAEEPKNMAPQMGNPKLNDPQVMAPKMDNPQKDAPKGEELSKDKSNAEILKELGVKDINSGIINNADVVLNLKIDEKDHITVVLDKDKINRNHLKVTNTISAQDIKTLKDSSGKLLGYYGYMQLNQVRQDENYSDEKVSLNEYYLLSMNDADKIRPTKSISYKGDMFYSYKDVGNQKLKASVEASYDDATKKVSMKVFGENNDYWKLGEFGRTNLLENQVTGAKVGEDGTIINGTLYSKIDNFPLKLTPDANFSGGIFGKNGEVLAGSAISEKWQGVIGATATTKEDKK
ncbi:transferrin-binding protein-like solute binding protein [Actinobacillus pleuropneumoniae]|uniref:Outer membrane lipoprotein n=2 Tax=Actinobacillus pleuropneumoniae TaxID=715 RepID=Q9RCG1_ACTPL|nr:transferrin-binding protein-like solute binding protein [Actinobacillus pleuropneumoniae]AAD00620.1 outer membrane lipoprotein [Actinobacillus pleuropneumoniae]EFM99831.1 Outer membrane lipoprotein A [Actinobacillus pleuropneumoniae serovar 12 str. 1096]UKH17218.1 transferrin-binding protein-like solute binding protein [Actinobacillus pleuropneumoniae]UKH29471.1 transferrin-binding protein-like solute binding protein [Actinobacillus pleuropneumoniae]BAD99432.1 outer membrane lipoprotein [Ac